MKKLLSLLLALAMVFSLCACTAEDDSDGDKDREEVEYPISVDFEIEDRIYRLELESAKKAALTFESESLSREDLAYLGADVEDVSAEIHVRLPGTCRKKGDTYTLTLDSYRWVMSLSGKDRKEAQKQIKEFLSEDPEFGEKFAADLFTEEGAELDGRLGDRTYALAFELDDDVLKSMEFSQNGITENSFTFHSNGMVKRIVVYRNGQPYYYYEYDKKGNLVDEGTADSGDAPPETMVPTLPAPQPTQPAQPQPTQPPAVAPTEPTAPEQMHYNVEIWVADPIVDLTYQQINSFNANNPYGIYFNAVVEPVHEGDAATMVINDVAFAPDIYCFAQDQTARLFQAGALSPMDWELAVDVQDRNSAVSCEAAMYQGTLYAYPVTSDNGYFLYYDKSVISDWEAESLEMIIADCEVAGRNFGFDLSSGWYAASFFFGTGCTSRWVTDDLGQFVGIDDTFNSPEGLLALEGMKTLLNSACHTNDSASFSNTAAVVSGTWGYGSALAAYGSNLGVTDLPSFSAGGNQYHLGSFFGCKLMGVKPQADAAKEYALHLLANYLTNQQCQLERYQYVSWGPSNLDALQNAAVQNNPVLLALMKQADYAVPQGQIPNVWWETTATIAWQLENGVAPEDVLAQYEAAVWPIN